MTHCNSCGTTEPRTRYMTEDECDQIGIDYKDTELICFECESLEQTLKNYDEDYGADR